MQDALPAHKASPSPARRGPGEAGILGYEPVTTPLPDPSPLNAALRRAHRSALVSVAVCALAIGAMMFAADAEVEAEGEVDRIYSFTALALAAISILARRAVGTRKQLRAYIYASLASMLGAVGLGVLGIVVAVGTEEFSVALLYALAGALLLLRPPPQLAPAEPTGAESSGR